MDKRNFSNGQDLPLGLSMALSQNPDAMNHFAQLSSGEKQDIIARTHQIQSKGEMKQLVQNMVTGSVTELNTDLTSLIKSKFSM